MNLKALNIWGLVANFLGVIFLLYYYTKTSGATTETQVRRSLRELKGGYLSNGCI
jgi:hypothetical protein